MKDDERTPTEYVSLIVDTSHLPTREDMQAVIRELLTDEIVDEDMPSEAFQSFRTLKGMVGQSITWDTGGLSGEGVLVSYEEHESADCDCDECRRDRGR